VISYKQYLRDSAVPKEVLDVFLDPAKPSWAAFDPELGYVLGNSLQRNGVDGCATVSTSARSGARTSHVYAGRPCRINTYGDSFTECHQVSDAETWQEYLAGQICQPVGNFGVGGYGVYQAYRRMVRTEQTHDGAECVLLYIAVDDHCRSVMRCRYPVIRLTWDHQGGMAFHNNFWANIEMDLESQRFFERDNPLSTPESLYKMADPDFMVEVLKDDLMVQLYVANRVDPASLDYSRLNALAEVLGVSRIDSKDAESLRTSAANLASAYGFAATKHTVELARRFCGENDKTLMILLMCPKAIAQLLRGEPRYDQEIVDYLADTGVRHFDMSAVHKEDYGNFNLSIEDYLKRYFIGHYGPAGNHFFAYSIKDKVIELLDPRPITHRNDEHQPSDFEDYLPN